jgi:hypothetical protein
MKTLTIYANYPNVTGAIINAFLTAVSGHIKGFLKATAEDISPLYVQF